MGHGSHIRWVIGSWVNSNDPLPALLRSPDFVVNRFFMKLFNTNVIDTVKLCQDYFDFDLYLRVMIEKRRETFLARFDIVEKACVSLYMIT